MFKLDLPFSLKQQLENSDQIPELIAKIIIPKSNSTVPLMLLLIVVASHIDFKKLLFKNLIQLSQLMPFLMAITSPLIRNRPTV